MNLNDIYVEGGWPALRRIAKQVGAHPTYLYYCAANKKNKELSPRMVRKLMKIEPRITWEDTYTQNDNGVNNE